MRVDVRPVAREGPQTIPRHARHHDRHRDRGGAAWLWLAGGLATSGYFVWQAMAGSGLVNGPGLGSFMRFWGASVTPALSSSYLRTIADATVITLAFAGLGSVLAVMLGFIGGVLICGVWWRGSTGRRPTRHLAIVVLLRILNAVPRGVHEAVWALFLVAILGQDPLVGVLAIAIPFGAMTAKVYADIFDSADRRPYDNLRLGGAGRAAAFAYGLLPSAFPDLLSYAFYRFECAIRSAVILGMIGAGGLGFELSLSFLALNYAQMWTVIYALIVINVVVDHWSRLMRTKATPLIVRTSVPMMILGTVTSAAVLAPNLSSLVSDRTQLLAQEMAYQLFPPRLPGGLGHLVGQSLDTFLMALAAIFIAAFAAVPAAFLAQLSWDRTTVVAGPVRLLLHVARTIPLPVWALLFLFVLYPGPLPGIIALALYNFGVLGRLFAEVVENLDQRPSRAIRQLGASPPGVFAYAVVPQAAPRFFGYALYRWETAIRETVVVGVVGAGGLGRLLEERRAAFDYSQMLSVAIALIVLSAIVDACSTRIAATLP